MILTISDIDTSAPVELHDTGLSPFDVINRYSHLGESPATGSLNNTSGYSATSQMDHASTLSQSSSGIGNQPLHGISPFDYRPDSGPLPPFAGAGTGNSSVQTAVVDALRNTLPQMVRQASRKRIQS